MNVNPVLFLLCVSLFVFPFHLLMRAWLPHDFAPAVIVCVSLNLYLNLNAHIHALWQTEGNYRNHLHLPATAGMALLYSWLHGLKYGLLLFCAAPLAWYTGRVSDVFLGYL